MEEGQGRRMADVMDGDGREGRSEKGWGGKKSKERIKSPTWGLYRCTHGAVKGRRGGGKANRQLSRRISSATKIFVLQNGQGTVFCWVKRLVVCTIFFSCPHFSGASPVLGRVRSSLSLSFFFFFWPFDSLLQLVVIAVARTTGAHLSACG